MAGAFGSFPAAPAPAARRRSLFPWWVSLIVIGIGALLGLVWFLLGGLPITDHAAYGRIAVPGSGPVTLPQGAVWLQFEEDGVFGENDSADMPADLGVTVVGAAGPVAIERLSANLFSITVESTGRVPYGRIEVATAGEHQVTTAASPSSAVSPRVVFGEPPWDPFGSSIVGALVIFAPFLVIGLLLLVPLRRA